MGRWLFLASAAAVGVTVGVLLAEWVSGTRAMLHDLVRLLSTLVAQYSHEHPESNVPLDDVFRRVTASGRAARKALRRERGFTDPEEPSQ
jgi:hypothetical protein